ncbi:MAG TPA: hypothetical protein VHQ67_04630 [Nitrospiraceae bacterium]|jgi:hypothetical protein|nr:hypothetical protein [Nitrospiraceae bacterium]
MIHAHDEFLMLRDTLVGRPAGVKLAGLVVLAGVLALLASPEVAPQGHLEARQPFKLGLLWQPSVAAGGQDTCVTSQKPERLSSTP